MFPLVSTCGRASRATGNSRPRRPPRSSEGSSSTVTSRQASCSRRAAPTRSPWRAMTRRKGAVATAASRSSSCRRRRRGRRRREFLTGQPVYPGAGRSGRAARLERVDLPDAQSAEVVPTDLQPQHEPRLWAGRKEVGHALQMRWLVSVVERSRRLHDEGTLRAECSPTVTSISCVANWSTCSTGRSAPPFVLSSP
jgi:hypothetical protein